MALDPNVKSLLDNFANTEIALRTPGLPLSKSNPLIGTAIDAATQAKNSAYVPAVGSNWTGADPTNVADALDRIAAALVLAGHTP